MKIGQLSFDILFISFFLWRRYFDGCVGSTLFFLPEIFLMHWRKDHFNLFEAERPLWPLHVLMMRSLFEKGHLMNVWENVANSDCTMLQSPSTMCVAALLYTMWWMRFTKVENPQFLSLISHFSFEKLCYRRRLWY